MTFILEISVFISQTRTEYLSLLKRYIIIVPRASCMHDTGVNATAH